MIGERSGGAQISQLMKISARKTHQRVQVDVINLYFAVFERNELVTQYSNYERENFGKSDSALS